MVIPDPDWFSDPPNTVKLYWGGPKTSQDLVFGVAFYCDQPKAHLCNNHAV